ncbi:unnamed protein product [Mytilus coruscus]|uniref:Uncharacterized protein n=1 Tax=Mytilus coruscus TaxID=42192 RepID=A0A6J8B6X3_MYTCO|nr:unnamed protein product [Mytilus coruscus]
MGGKKSEVKRVTFSDTEHVQEQEEEKFAVRLVEKDDKKEVSANIEKRLKKTKDDLAETKIIVKKILNILIQDQRQLGPKVKMKQHIILKGAGKGSEMEARYTDDLEVIAGKLKVKWRSGGHNSDGSNKFVTLKGGLKFGIGTEIEYSIPLTDVNEIDRFSDNSLNDFEPFLSTDQPDEADRISDSLTANPETEKCSSTRIFHLIHYI